MLGQNEIRLLRLKPRCYQHPQSHLERFQNIAIFCDTEVVSRRPRPSYTALSYAWGDGNGNRSICVGNTILTVGINLEAALRELRAEQDDLVLWVDQLCINQEDEEEKSQQVKEMRNIYAQATHVIAWVGESADNSDLILKHFHSIGSKASRSTRGLTKNSFRHMMNHTLTGILPSLLDPESRQMISIAFQKFCRRPYWRRLWVIQEYAVARKLEVACGNARISNVHLLRALDALARLLDYLEDLGEQTSNDALVRLGFIVVKTFNTPFSSFLEGIVTRRYQYQRSKSTDNCLFKVLISSLVLESDHNHPECSDPRDRIFSLLGLANDASSFDGFLDYSSSCEDVYTKATKHMIDQGYVDILSYCHFPRDECMPSWVPDWRRMTFAPLAYDPWRDKCAFKASGNTSQDRKITSADPKELRLSGIMVDTIKNYGSAWISDWLGKLDVQATLKYFNEIENFCAQSQRIDQKQEALEAAQIAIAGLDPAVEEDDDEDIAAESYQRLRNSFENSTASEDGPIYDEDTWYRRALQFLRPCRPFISSSGFVGVGPIDIEVGDMIYIFLGGLVPYIVRERSSGVYNLVGEAYVHGIMYGEHMTSALMIRNIPLK